MTNPYEPAPEKVPKRVKRCGHWNPKRQEFEGGDDSTIEVIDGEEDLDFCRRYFRGERFDCMGCNTEIEWCGACDDCMEKFTASSVTIEKLLEDAGVPALMRSWTREGMIGGNKQSRAAITKWRTDKNTQLSLLTISGPSGAGKTGMAVIIARHELEHGRAVKFVILPDWLREISWLEREGGSRSEYQSVANFHGLLILDDLGAKRKGQQSVDEFSPAQIDVMFRLVNHRENEMLRTIVTTNRTLDRGEQTIQQLSERLATRMGRGRWVVWVKPKE